MLPVLGSDHQTAGCQTGRHAARGAGGQTVMEVFAGGVIAGDALYSFFNSVGADYLRRHIKFGLAKVRSGKGSGQLRHLDPIGTFHQCRILFS
jgi:hypothetical protein